MEKKMRLDKYLSDMGLGTRSEMKKLLKKGLITVNGTVTTDPACKVTSSDHVTCDGSPVQYEEYVYYMLNKPAGVVSATSDRKEKTVLDLITEPARKDLFPVGRLDKDTEGLLLITNDGALAHRLLSPARHVDKVYYAKVAGIITQEHVALFAQGLKVEEDFTAMPADLKVLSVDDGARESEIELTIREGKFHQVKRMIAAVGCEVLYLKRLSMGTLVLDETLGSGEYRRLTAEELQSLKG